MKTRHLARELALQTLYAMDFNHELDIAHIPTVFTGVNEIEYQALEEDVKFYGHHLIAGTVEHLEQIDAMIAKYSINRPLEKIDVVDRNILRLSVFTLLYDNEIHPHVVIDEAVKLSREFSTDVTYKFINGILDAMSKQIKREEQ